MTLTDDINIAKKRLEQATRHLLGAPDFFKNKRNLQFSKYLKKCKKNAISARKKLEALERKYCGIMKSKRLDKIK